MVSVSCPVDLFDHFLCVRRRKVKILHTVFKPLFIGCINKNMNTILHIMQYVVRASSDNYAGLVLYKIHDNSLLSQVNAVLKLSRSAAKGVSHLEKSRFCGFFLIAHLRNREVQFFGCHIYNVSVVILNIKQFAHTLCDKSSHRDIFSLFQTTDDNAPVFRCCNTYRHTCLQEWSGYIFYPPLYP